MPSPEDALAQLKAFEDHYGYPVDWMRALLASSPRAFEALNAVHPAAQHRERLAAPDYWVAKLAAVKVEDCGDCLQLNARLALEAGVPRAVVRAAVFDEALPDELEDVRAYAVAVAEHTDAPEDVEARVTARLDGGQLLELGLCIATGKLYPTIKRAAGYTRSCRLIEGI
ncbi:MAG: hypothetical protein H6739_33725 [Alphaproteobacteria bacterium]|nr:hypothetical protein [Alphaproteobacteria bacterium]